MSQMSHLGCRVGLSRHTSAPHAYVLGVLGQGTRVRLPATYELRIPHRLKSATLCERPRHLPPTRHLLLGIYLLLFLFVRHLLRRPGTQLLIPHVSGQPHCPRHASHLRYVPLDIHLW
jgi:hypothetical protein